ncbi:MAG: malto-oligosyltrehalose trehalohydrolase [Candidatus Thermoplasmatota archaeon]|nr:malto-oligosyltrehalose trehalohydrolase [Candidatus Thermoplasmatota archaeon]
MRLPLPSVPAECVSEMYHLSKIGITAVEFMPVAQFYGKWNWGYDGVFLYAPQNSYGRPEDLRRLVSECHREGMAAVLDVVYNHIGPVGNCLPMFGPFLSERYATPWGKTLNFDGPYCDPVRRFILDNALYWLDEYGFDGLRLDAVHGIIDTSPKHILQELMEEADALAGRENRHITIIAESDLNDPRIVMERERCGYGITAQWNDDFHHSIHSFLTGERNGYYEDYGDPSFISRTLNDGFLYSGRYSHHLHKFRGSPWNGLPQWKLVVCSQNHDQIGNRAYGERLSVLVDIHKLKAAAALVLLSPFTPMLFMGEEYGERAPFLFFIDAEDRDFADAVREGRKAEFIRFGWRDTPDPDDENTFISSKLRWNMSGKSAAPMLRYYSHLIALRKSFIGGKRHSFFSAWTGGNVRLSYSNGFEVYVRMSKNASAVPDEGKVVMHSEWRDFGGRIERGSARGRELLPFSAVAVQL